MTNLENKTKIKEKSNTLGSAMFFGAIAGINASFALNYITEFTDKASSADLYFGIASAAIAGISGTLSRHYANQKVK